MTPPGSIAPPDNIDRPMAATLGLGRAAPPYVSQFASPELVERACVDAATTGDDPRWRDSGARDLEEYVFWARRVCGMAAVRSWLLATRPDHEVPGVIALAREVEPYGGYVVREDGGVDGLVYAPLVEYLDQRWGVRSKVAAPLTLDEVVEHLRAGAGAAILSVSPEIRAGAAVAQRRGGHLVLAFDLTVNGDIVFHNPSGYRPATQASVALPPTTIEVFFSGRGVLLWTS